MSAETLVTGANKGIGLEIARQIRNAGLRIRLGILDEGPGRGAVALLRSEGVNARHVHIDPVTIEAAPSDIRAPEGLSDVLINNAGIVVPGDGSLCQHANGDQR